MSIGSRSGSVARRKGKRRILAPEQSRAARGLLGWTQRRLASESGLSLPTLCSFENGADSHIPRSIAAIRTALEKAGVEFLDNERADFEVGVLLRKSSKKSLAKKRTAEKSTALVGEIIHYFSKIEFILHEFNKTRGDKQRDDEAAVKRDVCGFLTRLKQVGTIVSRSRRPAAKIAHAQNLLDEIIAAYEFRNFLAHSVLSLSRSPRNASSFVFRRYREESDEPKIEKRVATLENLQTSATQIGRHSKQFAKLIAELSRDQRSWRRSE